MSVVRGVTEPARGGSRVVRWATVRSSSVRQTPWKIDGHRVERAVVG